MMVIYKITNMVNGKSYIGQTINTVEERWKRHQQDALTGRLNTHFARAIRKYSPKNFQVSIIEQVNSQEELTKREQYWINYYNSIKEGYNETNAIEKCGGNTYMSKTEEELKEIGEKIRQKKQGNLNVNATPVKCRSIKTGEEHFFGSQAEMQKWFNSSNHIFISRRCLGQIKRPYLGEWEIAYAQNEYNVVQQIKISKSIYIKPKSITVKNLMTNEEQTFLSYAAAERYFGLKKKSLSAKASKKPNTFVYNYQYQVTKNY